MTEAEWLTCADPMPMLEFLKGKASDRKLRLFSAACCRAVWDYLVSEFSRNAVTFVEGFADGKVTVEQIRECQQQHLNYYRSESRVYQILCECVRVLTGEPLNVVLVCHYAAAGVAFYQKGHSAHPATIKRENAIQSNLLREVIGNHFRPVAVDPAWLTPTVVALANSIYADKAFDRMPIIADALEEAGCDNEDILLHCRQPGEHVRGCWVIDLLTGRK